MEAVAAAEIVVEGRVQGVGYRAFAQRRALFVGLGGYAMNLRDGRVFVYAEGDRRLIQDYVKELERGPRGAQVVQASVRWVPPTGGFRSFDIRHAGMES